MYITTEYSYSSNCLRLYSSMILKKICKSNSKISGIRYQGIRYQVGPFTIVRHAALGGGVEMGVMPPPPQTIFCSRHFSEVCKKKKIENVMVLLSTPFLGASIIKSENKKFKKERTQGILFSPNFFWMKPSLSKTMLPTRWLK